MGAFAARASAALRWLFSIALLAWLILTGPLAISSIISDATHWDGVLFAPVGSWVTQLQGVVEPVPWVSALSPMMLNILYVLALTGFIAWYYFTNIWLFTRIQLQLASAGTLAAVDANDPEEEVFGDAVVTGTAAAGAVIALGPLGWIAAALITAVGYYVVMDKDDRKVKKAKAHAEEQSKKQQANRIALARDSVARFKRSETKKLIIAAFVVVAVVLGNFAAPTIVGLAKHSIN